MRKVCLKLTLPDVFPKWQIGGVCEVTRCQGHRCPSGSHVVTRNPGHPLATQSQDLPLRCGHSPGGPGNESGYMMEQGAKPGLEVAPV